MTALEIIQPLALGFLSAFVAVVLGQGVESWLAHYKRLKARLRR